HRLAVPDEEGDLVGGGRVVDRDRGGAEEHGAEVEHVELGDVPHHQHDAVPRPDALAPQPGGGRGDLVGVLAVGQLLEVAVGSLPAQRHDVAVRGHGVEEPTGDRLALHRSVELVLRDLAHGSSGVDGTPILASSPPFGSLGANRAVDAGAGQRAGSAIVTPAPGPARASARAIEPSSTSTIVRAMASPAPSPGTVDTCWERANISKAVPRASSPKPGPRSRTSSVQRSPSRWADSSATPPYLMAL